MLQVYSHRDIPWILAQGQPPLRAIRVFGTLRHEGGFPLSCLTDAERRIVLGEIRAHEFALVPRATAKRLLAATARELNGRATRWFPLRLDEPYFA
jgi:hypothetical protein